MKYLKGRTYDDFTAYADENPELSIVEMDTVYNNSTAGPFMQTFKFLSYSFMFIIYHEENMINLLNLIKYTLLLLRATVYEIAMARCFFP